MAHIVFSLLLFIPKIKAESKQSKFTKYNSQRFSQTIYSYSIYTKIYFYASMFVFFGKSEENNLIRNDRSKPSNSNVHKSKKQPIQRRNKPVHAMSEMSGVCRE